MRVDKCQKKLYNEFRQFCTKTFDQHCLKMPSLTEKIKRYENTERQFQL